MSRLEMAETDRRLAGLIRTGRVEEADPATGRLRLRIGDILTGWVPVLALRAGPDRTWWLPEPGEHVLVLAPGGEPDQALVLGSLYQDAHPAPADSADVARIVWSDGATVDYDRKAHAMRVILPAGATLAIEADGGVTVRGTITVEGDVIADGVSLKTHTHGGIRAGGSNTARPNGGTA